MHRLFIGALAAMLLLAACGGSSGKNKAAAAGSTTTTTASAGESSTTTASGGNAELATLLAKRSTASIKLTYDYVGGTTLVVAQDGKGKSSVQIAGALFISDGKKSISCSGTTADATCTDVSSIAGAGAAGAITNSLNAFYSGLSTLNTADYGGHTSSETIAGRDATCVTYKASGLGALAALAGGSPLGADASSTTCVDKETGFLLKVAVGAGGTATNFLLATQAGTSSASDFEPPSTPQTFPSFTLPGGSTVPSG